MSRPHPVVAYLEERGRRRRELARAIILTIAILAVTLLLLVLAVRTFLHVTGMGAHTTVQYSLDTGQVRTVTTPVAIIP